MNKDNICKCCINYIRLSNKIHLCNRTAKEVKDNDSCMYFVCRKSRVKLHDCR